MTEINSNDYHDFVIKDGKLIGEFEQMYQKSSDVPWHQDKQENDLDIRLTIELLKEFAYFDTIVDFGCGLGYFLKTIKEHVGTPSCHPIGYDVSKTCCEQAKKLFPDCTFHEFNLMRNDNQDYFETFGDKNLFSLRGTLWYVFPKIENVVNNISKATAKGDLLLISQNFMPLDGKFVGKEVIPNPNKIIELFNDFTPIKTIFLEDVQSKDNSNWFIGMFSRK